MRNEGGRAFVVGIGCFWRGEIEVLLVDLLFEEDEARFSLLPMNLIVHSFTPNLGLAFVAFILIHLGMMDGMIDSRTLRVGWMIFALFGVGVA